MALGVFVAAAVVARAAGGPLAYGIAWTVQAAVLVGAAAALHEATHHNLYASARANRAAGISWGALLLVNYSAYRAFHLHHHANTATADDAEPRVEFGRFAHYLAGVPAFGWFFVVELWVTSVRSLFGAGRSPAYVRTERQRRAIASDACALVVILAVLGALAVRWPSIVLTVWAVPFALAVTFGLAIPSMPEHYGCGDGRDALEHTRTVRSNVLFRFLLWNNNFHAEHHLYPAVPWHNQPKLHEYLAAAGRHHHLEASYARWHARLAWSLWRERSPSPAPHELAAPPPSS